jgi:hypothetical protein
MDLVSSFISASFLANRAVDLAEGHALELPVHVYKPVRTSLVFAGSWNTFGHELLMSGEFTPPTAHIQE